LTVLWKHHSVVLPVKFSLWRGDEQPGHIRGAGGRRGGRRRGSKRRKTFKSFAKELE